MRALRDWPRHGVPPEPRAWLTLTARRAAIDTLRRESCAHGQGAGREAGGGDERPRSADGLRGARRPVAVDLHVLPPGPRARRAGPAGAAHAVRAEPGADRRGAADERGRRVEAADPGPHEDRPGAHPVPGALRRRPARAARRRVCGRAQLLHRGAHRDVRPAGERRRRVCRGGAAGPPRARRDARRSDAVGRAGSRAADRGAPPGPHRRRGRGGRARRAGPSPVGHRVDRRGTGAARRVVAAQRGHRRPLPAAGGDRRRARVRPDLRRDRLGRDRAALRPAAHRAALRRPRRSGGPSRSPRLHGPEAGLAALGTADDDPRREDPRRDAVRSELLARAGRLAEAAARRPRLVHRRG